MKRLLVVNVFFSPRSFGGATVVAEEVARRLAVSGEWNVSVLSFSGYGDVARPVTMKTELPGGIEHYTINFGGAVSRALSFENPAIAAEAARVIAHVAPDAAHVHCVQELGVGVIDALADAGAPILLSTHDYWWLCERVFMMNDKGAFCDQDKLRLRVCGPCVENAATLPARWRRARRTLRKAARITYPSRHARAQHERNGAPKDRGEVLPNGVARPAAGPAADRERARRDGPLRFGYVGGPGPIKGWPMIERAFRALDPARARLVLVDAATNLGGAWWRDYRFGPLAEHVDVVPGYTMETADAFYEGIDVLLFTSQWKETFGLTAREAALRGVHVLATDCGAPVEPLIDGDTATILTGFGTVRELRRTLNDLTENGPPRPTDEGRARIAAEVVTFDRQAAEVARLLAEIADP